MPDIVNLNGLPAHPFIVHLPVVFVPLAAIGAILALFVARWRSWLLPLTAAFAAISLAGVQLAIMSGQGLEGLQNEERALIERHSNLAEQARPIVFVFFLLALAAAVLVRRSTVDRDRADAGTTQVRMARALMPLMLASVLVGGLSTAWVYRTGHTGAESVWQGEGSKDKAATASADGDKPAPAAGGVADGDGG